MRARFVPERFLSLFFLLCLGALACPGRAAAQEEAAAASWPEVRLETRPWAYWWWMGNAVDTTNLTRELQRYHEAGLGGVHIIPIYGAKGFEDRFIDYLSPRWMQMLAYTVSEAKRLRMGVDMTTGTGWCFGGPHVTDAEANALVVVKTFDVAPGARLEAKLDATKTQAVVAFSPEGKALDLTGRLRADGRVDWTAENGRWRVYAVSQKPSGQKVKRASPGGQGHMLNLFYPEAMRHYLAWFDAAFAHYTGPKPRAMYHDSYEYRSDWAPDLFASFKRRRGYRLQNELPALFGPESSGVEADHVARVKSDYRETLSDIMAEDTLPRWVKWSHRNGFITRNEAHGSPGNLLDLYAVADIPETEMFYQDRNKLVSKFASSAAHVSGKQFASSETGTWLKEHFTETLADVKYLFDDMFLSGINHMFYHGTCYSPDEAGWPGWHFYASLEMNPRNALWRDAPQVNAYATRCQSVLQAGRPDNDILLYWPIYDFWHNAAGMVQPMSVHGRGWFEDQPIGQAAARLWGRGYAFDYVSDRQLAAAKAVAGGIAMPGGSYRVVVVPEAKHLPVETMRKLLALAEAGATVIFGRELPADVPGWGELARRRAQMGTLLQRVRLEQSGNDLKTARLGHGRVLAGDVEAALESAGVKRETMFDQPGLMCVRRAVAEGRYYFIANRSEQKPVNGWVPLAGRFDSVVLMEPLSGRTGALATRANGAAGQQVRLSLDPGQSVILHCLASAKMEGPRWTWSEPCGQPVELGGPWQLQFIQGGPELPAACSLPHPGSWTELDDTNAQRFAGTALYTLQFDAPDASARSWSLDLGKVCQSARVRLNGAELGTLITPPFKLALGPLRAKGNQLEVEVTNVSANRIRDLDRRGVKWKSYYDINFVGLDYRPFDASKWPLTPSGLIGPVTLTPTAPAP